jgi:hypothetical protein
VPSGRRLLILSCSQRKRQDEEPLPAVERYDGPTFRVLRRFLREKTSAAPDILVLSAEFGLISSAMTIPDYDQRMTKRRAQEIKPLVVASLKRTLSTQTYGEALVLVGADYLEALGDCRNLFSRRTHVRFGKGPMGKKLSILRDWLYGGYPPPRTCSVRESRPRGRARLRGIEVALTAEQVLDLARRALPEDGNGSSSYRSWYVPVDNRRVAPKWLVSRLTGLPVGAFQAREARNFLLRLGVEVQGV